MSNADLLGVGRADDHDAERRPGCCRGARDCDGRQVEQVAKAGVSAHRPVGADRVGPHLRQGRWFGRGGQQQRIEAAEQLGRGRPRVRQRMQAGGEAGAGDVPGGADGLRDRRVGAGGLRGEELSHRGVAFGDHSRVVDASGLVEQCRDVDRLDRASGGFGRGRGLRESVPMLGG